MELRGVWCETLQQQYKTSMSSGIFSAVFSHFKKEILDDNQSYLVNEFFF